VVEISSPANSQSTTKTFQSGLSTVITETIHWHKFLQKMPPNMIGKEFQHQPNTSTSRPSKVRAYNQLIIT